MKIRQAPVADLLKYVEELFENKTNTKCENVLDLLDTYYCLLSSYKTIKPIGEFCLADWCDLNHSATMENCPNVPGIIVYKKRPNNTYVYGLLFHSGQILSKDYQTEYLSYYTIDKNGYLIANTYLAKEWDGWAAPIRFFNYGEAYVDNHDWCFGDRPLTIHRMGHDVKYFQTMLRTIYPDIEVSGYFDENTLEALHNLQKLCNVSNSDFFNIKSPDGRKLLAFITNEC